MQTGCSERSTQTARALTGTAVIPAQALKMDKLDDGLEPDLAGESHRCEFRCDAALMQILGVAVANGHNGPRIDAATQLSSDVSRGGNDIRASPYFHLSYAALFPFACREAGARAGELNSLRRAGWNSTWSPELVLRSRDGRLMN